LAKGVIFFIFNQYVQRTRNTNEINEFRFSKFNINILGEKIMNRKLSIFKTICILTFGLFLFTAIGVTAQTQKFLRTENSVNGKYIIIFDENQQENQNRISSVNDVSTLASEVTAKYEAKIAEVYSEAVKGFSANLSEKEAIALSEDSRIKYIIEDEIVKINGIQKNASWGLDRIDQRSQNPDTKYIDTFNGSGVNVFVIDTGINPYHAEFQGRASIGADFVGDGQNGFDCNGHGTHVAGTVAGITTGVAKNARVIGVRVLGCNGSGTASGLLSGIEWVIRNRTIPAVANMSLGFGGINPVVDTAVHNLVASGVTTVVAAGNDYGQDASNYTPARVTEAITVGATNIQDVRADFSNVGSVVDIFAPGNDIKSAWYNGGYVNLSGTSMASPHVAGAAAQVLQLFPNASPSDVEQYLKNYATKNVIGDTRGGQNNLLFNYFANHCGLFMPGQTLYKGQSISSCSGNTRLIFQTDGNVVLYRNDGVALWHTRTNGKTNATYFTMQNDGNLVLYTNTWSPLWNSRTAGNTNAFLFLQDDRNLVIYNDRFDRALWNTGTSGR
jgi:subtilisin family serine protease